MVGLAMTCVTASSSAALILGGISVRVAEAFAKETDHQFLPARRAERLEQRLKLFADCGSAELCPASDGGFGEAKEQERQDPLFLLGQRMKLADARDVTDA